MYPSIPRFRDSEVLRGVGRIPLSFEAPAPERLTTLGPVYDTNRLPVQRDEAIRLSLEETANGNLYKT
jgi:hypothetical protein